MIVATLGASLGLSGYAGVYVVRDSAGRVAYIGQSKDVGRRLAQHRRAASSFGQAIRASAGSDDWRVSLLSVADCAQVAGRPCNDLDSAEAAMIQTMGPMHNTQHNASGKDKAANLPVSPGLREAILRVGLARVAAWGLR